MIYYNEHDKKAAEWLRVLSMIDAINPGIVDDRDVQDVQVDDVRDMVQCHFFAGIGGWSYALDLAGWPRDYPVWTASLPCQPFSPAGKQLGQHDERHLWPHFRDIVEQCLPPIIFGEQVSSKKALGASTYVTKTKSLEHLLAEAAAGAEGEPDWAWFPVVQADLEDLGYIVGASDIPAAGVGAPHIRQRLYWCAYLPGWIPGDGVEYPDVQGREGPTHRTQAGPPEGTGGSGRAGQHYPSQREAHDHRERQQERAQTDLQRAISGGGTPQRDDPLRRGDSGVCWSNVVYVPCADGKARPVKPGVEPLVDGLSPDLGLGRGNSAPYSVGDFNSSEARVMKLRGFGNAIVPQVAATFVRTVMDVLGR